MRVGLIGLGNLGTAVANLIASNGHEVVGWDHQSEVVDEISSSHRNSRYLAGIDLHPGFTATSDLGGLVASCHVVFIALPARFIEPTLAPVADAIRADAIVVNMAKGIDVKSGLTGLQMLGELLPEQPLVMLSGPSIANEFAHRMPTVVVVAGPDRTDLLRVSTLLDNEYFRTRFSDDAIGVELGGVLKNIYAIGLGMFDGQDVSSINFRAVYLTIAVEEMARLGAAVGARLETFLYLAGIGDLLATALSEHSHNRHMGQRLAEGLTRDQIRDEMGVLPEGYSTLRSTLYVAEKLHVSAPLAKGLWDVIHGRQTADRFITSFIHDFVE
jgi:glycerol-3-phosphate dehydrogenase (NAD(P)+)